MSESWCWYVIQVSHRGADDWNAVGNTTYDTLTAAKCGVRHVEGFDYRIVCVVLSEEVIAVYPEVMGASHGN